MKTTTASLLGLLALPLSALAQHHEGRTDYEAPHADIAPVVDGMDDDAAWANAAWQPLKHNWLGPEIDGSDFSGRYKVVWTEERIYLLAELVDDVLYDTYRDPLVQYWDDDTLEIFIDEDFSGGDHQFNHNAFAYHMSLDNRAIDIGTDKKPRDYSHHVDSQWRQHGEHFIWEVAIDIYDDSYVDDSMDNAPLTLSAGKVMGMMVAYCDNDASELRENFVGSELTFDGKTDWGWIDAGLFGRLVLTE
ncbi:MAG: sugar-binding protein [Pseudomonadota bacterium]